MSDTKARVYNLIRMKDEMEYQDIVLILGISIEEVQRACEDLEEEGLIEHEDSWLYDYIWEQMKADKNG